MGYKFPRATLENLEKLCEKNNPDRKGQPASPKVLFGGPGENDSATRYSVQAVHTRFGAVEWFVMDAEQEDTCGGGPATIRQGSTLADAIAGLV